MNSVRHAGLMMVRDTRAMLRQPWFVAITLIQPLIWLLLYGALFKKIVELPGFGSGSYIEYLAPGVVVMTAIFSAGWVGMSNVEEIERGTMDRLLASPVNRGALIVGRVGYAAVSVVIQAVVIIGLAFLMGAHFHNGLGGVVGLVLLAALVGSAFAALSCGLGLVAHQRETLIGINTMIMLPLVFLSSAFMQKKLMPDWMQHVADFNPVNWAIEAGRSIAMQSPDWTLVWSRTTMLAALLVVSAFLATSAFRTYQRSI